MLLAIKLNYPFRCLLVPFHGIFVSDAFTFDGISVIAAEPHIKRCVISGTTALIGDYCCRLFHLYPPFIARTYFSYQEKYHTFTVNAADFVLSWPAAGQVIFRSILTSGSQESTRIPMGP